VTGRKIYISRVEQSDLMILLARTTPVDEVEKRSGGLTVLLVNLREAEGLTVRPRRVMMNNATSELAFEGFGSLQRALSVKREKVSATSSTA
jgi:acyl-CoA dehydrogenase